MMDSAHDFTDNSRPIYLSKDLSQLKGISFTSLNICSAYKKVDDILTILNNSELDYLSITESWLNASISNDDIDIEGYTVTRLDRDGGLTKRGGVVFSYIQKAMPREILDMFWNGISVAQTVNGSGRS